MEVSKGRNVNQEIGIAKIVRGMKLSFLMVLVFCVQISATTYSQETKLNLQTTNSNIKDVLKQVKAQSRFTFLYNDEDIANVAPVSINAQGANIDEVLEQCLKNTGLTYEIKDDVIIIKPAPVVQQPENVIVKGKVVDDEGLPVPGANIILLEYNTGTITNVDGVFELKIPGGEGTLAISFIGFEKQEVAINGRTQIDVQLKMAVSQLGDVVVTGYGKRSTDSYTGAAVAVSADDLSKVNNPNLLMSLQSLEPSFVMVENLEAGSNPNAIPEFQIRGTASVPGLESEYKGSTNMPLFILDGFESDVTTIFDMDPSRVKSMTILKDASATAIYGSRAANGVVVIETVAPQPGKMRVRLNSDFSLSAPDLTVYDLLNAEEKLELEKEANYYLHYPKDAVPVKTIEAEQAKYSLKLQQVREGVDTYWLSKPVQVGFSQNHSLSLDGGSDSFRYGMEVRYKDQNGVMKESGRDNYRMAIDLQYRMNKFTFKNRLTYDQVNAFNSPYGNFSTYAKLNPYYKPTDEDGNLLYQLDNVEGRNVYNPLFNASLYTIDQDKSYKFRNNFVTEWNLSASSTIRGSISLFQTTENGDVFKSAKHTDFANVELARKGKYTVSSAEQTGVEGKITYSYLKNINKHMFYLSATGEMQESKYNSYTAVAEGFPSDNLTHMSFAKQYTEGRPGGSEYTTRSIGTLGSFNYAYDNRFFADFSCRMDASSRFGANSRWAPFGAVGAGWNMHNESFFKTVNAIDKLKLRASYGLTGSQNFDPNQAITAYELYRDTRYHYGYGFNMIAIGNENLKWQQSLKTNVGLDVELLNRRIQLRADIYNDVTKDVLVPVTLPTSLGFSSYMENLGVIQNQGYEVKLTGYLLKKNDLSWSMSMSATHNENTLKEISNSLSAINEKVDEDYDTATNDDINNKPSVRYIEGESFNTIWAVRSLGIDPATGQEVFLTKNGEKTFEWNSADQVPCGVTDPDLLGTFGTFLMWKGFQLNMQFMYRIGGQMYNQTLVDRVENANKWYNVDRRVLEDRWMQPGDMTFFKDIKDDEKTKPTSRFVEDYNYLNLSALSMSYDFNVSKWKLKRFKVLFSMNDVFRVSSVKVERGTNYPFARTFTLSLKTEF